jgi:capsule polysaccharide export protein KpsE/RkpR
MTENKNFEFIDYFVLIVKWKKFLVVSFLLSLIIGYLLIFFLIDEKYDSTALIIPAEGGDVTGISSIMKSFTNLPISVPGLSGNKETTDIYTTIIFSRQSLQKLVDKFNLMSEYDDKNIDETIKALSNDITADETQKGAYEITVRSSSAKKASEMTNFMVEQLNSTLINLNTTKARENRFFLQKRYEDVKNNLHASQDSLVRYQRKSGIIFVEEQAKSSIEAYAKLESEMLVKEIEVNVLTKLYGEDAPQTQNANIAYSEFQNKFMKLKSGEEKSELLLPIENLPEKAMTYLRYYSDVEINKTLMEFILPLYEQSKFEEQKSIPFIQIIDRGSIPTKKSFPPRILFTLLLAVIICSTLLSVIILREKIKNSENLKVKFIADNLFKF